MENMNKNEWIEEIKKLNINLTEEQIDKLDEYANFLLEYNQYTNLTAIKTKEEVYLKHFYDSLTLIKIANLMFLKITYLYKYDFSKSIIYHQLSGGFFISIWHKSIF